MNGVEQVALTSRERGERYRTRTGVGLSAVVRTGSSDRYRQATPIGSPGRHVCSPRTARRRPGRGRRQRHGRPALPPAPRRARPHPAPPGHDLLRRDPPRLRPGPAVVVVRPPRRRRAVDGRARLLRRERHRRADRRRGRRHRPRHGGSCSPPAATRSPTTAWCSRPAAVPSCRRCPAPTVPACSCTGRSTTSRPSTPGRGGLTSAAASSSAAACSAWRRRTPCVSSGSTPTSSSSLPSSCPPSSTRAAPRPCGPGSRSSASRCTAGSRPSRWSASPTMPPAQWPGWRSPTARASMPSWW